MNSAEERDRAIVTDPVKQGQKINTTAIFSHLP